MEDHIENRQQSGLRAARSVRVDVVLVFMLSSPSGMCIYMINAYYGVVTWHQIYCYIIRMG